MKKLPLKVRKELTSFALTLSVALGAAVLAWLETDAPLTKTALVAVIASGLRAGLKAGLMVLLKR